MSQVVNANMTEKFSHHDHQMKATFRNYLEALFYRFAFPCTQV